MNVSMVAIAITIIPAIAAFRGVLSSRGRERWFWTMLAGVLVGYWLVVLFQVVDKGRPAFAEGVVVKRETSHHHVMTPGSLRGPEQYSSYVSTVRVGKTELEMATYLPRGEMVCVELREGRFSGYTYHRLVDLSECDEVSDLTDVGVSEDGSPNVR